jgi:hypothetical protein
LAGLRAVTQRRERAETRLNGTSPVREGKGPCEEVVGCGVVSLTQSEPLVEMW